MASENEASCESDPNFAVICGFLEKFGVPCGLTNIDFVDLQEMLENTQEVSQELIELHIKLMRRARRSVSSNDRWERALIKTCHTFSSQDAWEIERFGYKKARISSKLRVLKELLEMQFDYNQKFKNEINKMSAVELRTQPLGRDRIGRAYWYQCDESCQIRVYKDDPDDETWTLVAKNRDGLVSLISQLGNGDTAKSSSEPVSNEDSNSVEVEKPILDTGQSKDSSPKPKDVSENVESEEKMEVEPPPVVENEKEDVEESKLEDNNSNLPDTQIEGEESGNEENGVKNGIETESTVDDRSDDNVVESKKEDVNNDLSDNRQESNNKEESVEETCENALNLCSKDLSNKDDAQEEKSGLDLSVKAAPCLRIKPITELMAQPQHLDMQKKEFMGIKGKYIRNDSMEKGMLYPNPTHLGKAVQSASYDAICYKRSINEDIYAAPTSLKQPRFDRPTLLGNKKYMSYMNEEDDEDEEDEEMDDEIEGPLMLVQGEGSGFPNESVNEQSGESPIVGDEIEEAVLYVTGEGNGADCETGNKFSERSEDGKMKESDNPDSSGKSRGFPSKNQGSLEGTNEKVVDDSKGDETSIPSVDTSNESPESPESANSPVKQTFFFGNSFSPSTSPMKTASLSFGASTVVDNQSDNSPSISPSSPTDLVEGSKNCSEKTDQNLIGNTPSNSTKVPENVDIENIDNNRDISASLSDKISKESECGQQECDNMLIDPSDSNASEINKDTVDRGDNLVDSEVKLPVTQDKEIDSKLCLSENLPTPTGSPQNEDDQRDEESDSDSEKSEDQSEAVILKDGNERKTDLTESSNDNSQDVTTSDEQDLQTIDASKETNQIEEQVSSTLTEEESTTSDETNALVTSSSVEKETPTVKNDATNAISNVCIQDRQVTGADEFETIDSSEDESNFNEILDNSVSANDDEDIPSSTTDKEVTAEDSESKDEVDCNKGDDPESTPSETKESERSIEPIQTESCISKKNELSMLEEERNKNTCKSECIIDTFNTSPKENPTESVEEIDEDNVDDNRLEENNDLLLEKGNNEVDRDDSTKNNLEVELDEIDDDTRAAVDDSNLDDDDLKGAESSDDHEDTPTRTPTETKDDDCETAEETRIETNSSKVVDAHDSVDSPSTLEEKSVENEVTKVEKDVEEIDRQETQPTEVDNEEIDAVDLTSKNIAVKPTTTAQLTSKELEGKIIEDPKEERIETKQLDEEKVDDFKEKPCNEENVVSIDNDEDQQLDLETKSEDAEIQEKNANENQVQNNLKDNLPSNPIKEKQETTTDIDDPQQDELPSKINQTHKTISREEKLETTGTGEKETVKIAVAVDVEEQLSTPPISDKLIDLEEQLNTSSETTQTINKQEQLNTLETNKVKDREEQLITSPEKNNKVIDVEEQLNTSSEMNNKDADITPPSSGIDKDSPVIIVETDEDTSDNRCGIDALKAIKITNVQAKCEILDKIDDTSSNTNKKQKEKVENVDDKKRNDSKEKVTEPQPLRFLRGRRPTQMLSVKSYATRNKNLVLRKETKPPPEINDENKTKEKEVVIKKEASLLCVVKVERHVENNVRRSTRRKPGDSQEKPPETLPESVSVDVKKIKGRSRKTAQAPQETKQTEEGDLRYSKRLRLSNNQAPSSIEVETIDLTSETDGKKTSVKNCNETVPLKKEMKIQPTYEKDKDEKKSSKKNGPFLTCVNIQKLKENPVDHVESPLSVESSGGGDNSDVVIIEDDPLAVPEPYEPASVKTITLNSFQLDYPSPPPMVMTRSLRKRCRPEPEIPIPTGGKRRKTKVKRQVDLELRRSIEEQKQQEVSSSDDDKKQTSLKRKSQQYKKKQEVTNNVEPPVVVEPVKKPRAPRKKTLLGLDVPAVIEELASDLGNVRHSRRIAQLKIKEEAERRKLEDITMTEPKGTKKKGKKNIDKDYKAEKRKRTKPPTEEEVTVDVPEVEEKKTKRKRKRKHKDPRKIFDEANPWRSSSGSSSSNDEVEEEEEIVEYSDAESPLFKSDHEFSPESDIEDTEEPQPMKRARTARKEDDVEDDVDDHACQRCGKSDHPEWILLCDSCDNGWHCSCLRPALFIIPEGDWFCPPCQHNSLVKQLEEKLSEYDKKVAKRDIQVRRKERLAYVGISLANVLPVKDVDERRKKKENSEDEDEEDEESRTEDSSSSSESSSSSDSDEPIYQLRQRRQAHSYRFNDYDELINSAIQEEMEAVKGAGNQGRGKDISTIVNAEKEEQAEKDKQQQEEELPPVVPVETKELPPAVVPSERNDSEEETIKPVKKFFGRKKQRKLNSLDVSSGDDPDSDEDFKGSSSDEDDDDDFDDMGSDSSEVYGGRRRKGMAVRRSTRARTSRYDKDFINDDSDDDEEKDIPRKKKSRSTWNESETEESDTSWKWSSRRKSTRNTTSRKKRSKKSKKRFDDSDEDRSKKKKRRIKYGGLNDDEEEEETAGRRTRGKKINYADVLASDSDDEVKKKAPPRIESDDDYVANEDQDQDDDEEFEKEGSMEKEEETIVKEKEPTQTPIPEKDSKPEVETSPVEDAPVSELSERPVQNDPVPTPPENFDLDNLNSSIDDLPDDIGDDNDDDDTELNPIEEINKNLEEMDEAEMEKLMEEEEYANKQLQLVAMQLEKQKKRKQKEAKKNETAAEADPNVPKKRGRKSKPRTPTPASNVVQIATLQVGPDMQSNPELSEPPGVTIPIFSEIPPTTTVEGSPKKRRGRGKGKKTLEKEAAAAAAAAGVNSNPPTTPSHVIPEVGEEQSHIPTTVDTIANVNSDDMSLANAAAIHGAKLAIAAPPQPFSQTQPTPSVITRMLQGQSGQGSYSPMGMGHNYYADQPPPHAENPPTPPVSNAQMATCVPVSNSMAANHNSAGQLPPMSQPQQQYMHGAPPPRGMSSTAYRQPSPNVNPYHRTSPAPPIPQIRVRNATPAIPPVYHTHHPLDPSPSGGGPINVPTSSMNTPERSSPISIPPSSDSPLSNKSDPTPPPPPYSRPSMRFSNVNTSPMASSPIRQQQNLLPPQHLQQQPSPLRNNMPYHPTNMPSNYYSGYMGGNLGPEETLTPSGYHYSDQFSETNSPQDIGKSYDEENSGEFGGLVSYFSSQREDDLDT